MPEHRGYNPIRTMDSSEIIENRVVSPSAHSSQQLMSNTDTESVSGGSLSERNQNPPSNNSQSNEKRVITKKDWITVGILCFVNLINYMDRFTVAGVLTSIQDTFNIGDDKAGLLQTAFILSYMICAPIFGYLGDRYSRRYIMTIGVLIWSGTTVLGSFMNDFGWFITFRALVGVGEASYSTIAPTIISDLFVNNLRSKMLALFYFAIPVGSGFGYMIGSQTANLTGSWRWALRVTPILGAVAVFLIVFIMKEPERGESEGTLGSESTSYIEDLKDLIKNRTFMLSTLGFTCVAFVAGALSWWGPKFMFRGLSMQPEYHNITENEVSLTFGILTMVAGIIGVILGSYLSQKLKKRLPSIDPTLCAVGLILSAVFLNGAMILVTKNKILSYTLCFIGQLALNINWAIVADILLYVVIPTRRSTAEAFQILISHMFGDAGSPYLIGVMSEAIKSHLKTNSTTITNREESAAIHNNENTEVEFQSLQYSLFATSFIEILGAVFFLLATIYIVKDKLRASQIIKDNQTVPRPNHIYADSS